MEEVQTFKCLVCDQKFDQYGLELHFITAHAEIEDEEEEETIEDQIESNHIPEEPILPSTSETLTNNESSNFGGFNSAFNRYQSTEQPLEESHRDQSNNFEHKDDNSTSNANNVVNKTTPEPNVDDVDLEELVEVEESQTIPWFAGCEYLCQYEDCRTMFFYNQDLRKHISKKHENPNTYLEKFNVLESKTEHIECKICSTKIKRHFSSMFCHLRDHHDDMKLEEYQKKYKIIQDYVKIYKVTKKRKLLIQEEERKKKSENPEKDNEEEKVDPEKMVEVVERQKIPWFSGCEYLCQYEDCRMMFFYNQDLRKHIRKNHENSNIYLEKFKLYETKSEYIECKICSEKLKHHFSSISNHMRDFHDDMPLEDYQQKYKIKPDYVKKYKIKKKLRMVEQEKLQRKEKLIAKREARIKASIKSGYKFQNLQCFYKGCGENFHTRQDLIDHETLHEEWKCPFVGCGMWYTTKPKLKFHEKIHENSPGGQYECDSCDKIFNTKSARYTHRFTHFEISCRFKCGLTFKSNGVRIRHERVVHMNICVKCDICQKPLNSKAELSAHRKTHLNPSQRTDLFKCNFCEETFETGTKLSKHEFKVHQRAKFKCEKCDKLFLTEKFYKIHVEKQNCTKLLFSCKICQSTSTSDPSTSDTSELERKYTSSGLKNHMASKHSSNSFFHSATRVWKCNECKIAFSNNTSYKFHIKEKHMAGRMFGQHSNRGAQPIQRRVIAPKIVVPRPQHVVPQQRVVVPQPQRIVPQQRVVVPQPQRVVTQQPQHIVAPQPQHIVVPQPQHIVVSQPQHVVPQQHRVVVPQQQQRVFIPQQRVFVPQPQQQQRVFVPQPQHVVPQQHVEPQQQQRVFIPQPQHVVPQQQHVAALQSQDPINFVDIKPRRNTICDFCCLELGTEENLERHIQSAHNELAQNNSTGLNNTNTPTLIFTCNLCQLQFHGKNDLDYHVQYEHGVYEDTKPNLFF